MNATPESQRANEEQIEVNFQSAQRSSSRLSSNRLQSIAISLSEFLCFSVDLGRNCGVVGCCYY
jgi:hypothetical protein